MNLVERVEDELIKEIVFANTHGEADRAFNMTRTLRMLDAAVKALAFYAEKASWHASGSTCHKTIDVSDCKDTNIGGERARKAMAAIAVIAEEGPARSKENL